MDEAATYVCTVHMTGQTSGALDEKPLKVGMGVTNIYVHIDCKLQVKDWPTNKRSQPREKRSSLQLTEESDSTTKSNTVYS